MKEIIITVALLFLLLISPVVLGSQEKDIYLDTGGKVGHLIYTENYYSMNSDNNLTLDQGRIYFDGVINNSKITFMIIRPLDSNGSSYSESMIRAYATLDNKTILNTWYGSRNASNENQSRSNGVLQLIGFITIIIISLVIGFLTLKILKRMKKK